MVKFNIDVIVDNDLWAVLSLEAIAEKIIDAITAEAPTRMGGGEIAALFTCNDTVHRLNAQFRGRDKPTNVLSFPTGHYSALPMEMPAPLGDLALAYGVMAAEAAEKSISLADHTAHLLIHGVLHLFGYDHIEDNEAAEMETLETRILARMGISDPYAQ